MSDARKIIQERLWAMGADGHGLEQIANRQIMSRYATLEQRLENIETLMARQIIVALAALPPEAP